LNKIKKMKKITFLILYFQFIAVFAQFNPSAPWMDNVAKNQNGEASLNDIKMAFESYWAERNYKKKGSGYKPFMRWETHWQNKVNENGFLLTPEQMWQAWNQKKQSQMMRSAQDVESNWEPLGPFNHVNTGSWSSGQGRVNVVVLDPNKSNTIYIGTPAGGIWKSTDAGMNWTPLSDYLPQIGVSGIVVDHTNSDIIYIATGDKDANDTYSVGVMKSTDGELVEVKYKRANSYFLNGYEIGGGSIRIHQSDVQKKMFQTLGISDVDIKERFGFFTQALKYGTPPHGGIALGLDRLVMLLTHTKNIKDVVAFPKTQSARDLMMSAPSQVDEIQLDDLHIKVKK
jgi:hypothetical protein